MVSPQEIVSATEISRQPARAHRDILSSLQPTGAAGTLAVLRNPVQSEFTYGTHRFEAMATHLNVHQLEVFLAVARRGSITRAANELFISQPTVSEQVKQLERACGLSLLERQPRGVRLTDAGKAVYDYAERLFLAADELERTVAELRNALRGRLRVGASMTIGQHLLPGVMGEFGRRYPGVELSLAVGTSGEIVNRVISNELGLGFVGTAPNHAGLTVVPYLEDEIVVILAPEHELASHSVLSLEQLRRARWIAREPGSATRTEAEHCLKSAGVQLVPAMEVGSNEAVKSAVAAGLGFGLISRRDIGAETAADQLALRPVADWDCRRLFCICYRHDRRLSPVERAFLRFVGCDSGAQADGTTYRNQKYDTTRAPRSANETP
jgi:molybdate transport repressor ModE-like protein